MPCLRSINIKNPAIKVNHSKPGKKIGGLQECSTTGITMHLTVFCAVSINWSVEILGRIGTPCLLFKAVVYGGSLETKRNTEFLFQQVCMAR